MKLKRIIQMLNEGCSLNEIAAQTSSSKTTVAGYKKASLATDLSYEELLKLEDAELVRLLQPPSPTPNVDPRRAKLEEMMPEICKRMAKRHATIQLVHQEYYLKECPDGYGYTRFKKLVTDHLKNHSYSYHNAYVPGEEWQIDFAGDPLYVTDPVSLDVTKVAVLVCVMPYSELPFLYALPNATTEWFFKGLNKGLEFLGALPHIAKSDNMRQWVAKTDRYSPTMTEACMEWANYYRMGVTACRVRKPRDKGPVESVVHQLYLYVYARIQDEVFYSLESLNIRLRELLEEYIRLPYKGSTRLEIYQKEELPLMEELPKEMHRFRYRKTCKLASSYHVCIGAERHYYSVPYQYVNKEVTVMWDTDFVEVYNSVSERICIHKRNYISFGYTTSASHMPEAHKAYERSREQNAASLINRASFLGESVRWVVETMLKKPRFPQQAYNHCNAVLAMAQKVGRDRLEKACQMMKTETSTASLAILNNILKNKRDLETEPAAKGLPHNPNVRGASAFFNGGDDVDSSIAGKEMEI